MLPVRVHAIVLVSKLHKPTMRALAYARATRPDTLEALTVDVDADATPGAACSEWDEREHPGAAEGARLAVPRDHPAGHRLRASELRQASPRDIVTVYIPEYVVGHWWEQLLHNQSALRLKGRLLFTPGVMVTSVPYQLRLARARARARRGQDAGPAARATSAAALTGTSTWSDRRRVVEVGPVAHGGHCVARLDGRVVFVRHALPGERVRIRITERSRVGSCAPTRSRCWTPRRTGSRRRARTPGPGRCGGCDFQHVDAGGPAASSRRRSSRSSCGGWPASTWDVDVEAVEPPTGSAGDAGAVRGRRRTGRPGLRRHRSHEVVPVDGA